MRPLFICEFKKKEEIEYKNDLNDKGEVGIKVVHSAHPIVRCLQSKS